MRKALRSLLSGFFLILLCVFILPHACAQNRSTLRLNQTTVTLRNDAGHWLDSFSKHSKSPALAIVQVDGPLNAALKARFGQQGIQLQQALSGNFFIASINPGIQPNEASGILALTPVEPDWKLAPSLRRLKGQAGWVNVALRFLPNTNRDEIRQWIELAGGEIKASPLAAHNLFEVRIQGSELPQLLKRPELLFAGKAAMDQTLNLQSQRSTNVSLAHAPRNFGGWGLLGDSITVGVGDNVPGVSHVDLRDRIINYNSASAANHGQHVNGTVGGAGTMDPRGEGFAPRAHLLDFLFSQVWARTGDMLASHNMTVTNNSYANVVGDCDAAGVYDVYSEVLDTLVLMYPQVFHVFASGNDGGMTCAPYPTSFGTVTGGYQVAKNVLVVGNADKQYGANPGTSRGPVRDGRLKPEIAAIGSDVWSTKPGDAYLSAFGTSMACPQVSGATALLQQRYKQSHAGAYPSSPLLKALLMNGAMDAGIPGPDYSFGFGIMDLSRSLRMMDSNRYFTGSIQQGNRQNPLNIVVPAGTGQLKVTLYWHDAPASPMSSKQLINDLDLRVQSPDAAFHQPFILDAANPAQEAVRGEDHLNNVEQVVIDHPAAGSFPVEVTGHIIPSGSQEYTVVYDLIPEGVTLTTPWEGGVYKNMDAIVLYWTASPGTNTFKIEFSEDDGKTWTVVSDNIAADARQLQIFPAYANSAQCRMRIQRNGTSEQFVSGRFTFNTQPDLRLASQQCPGYASLEWSPVPNVDSYLVLQKRGPFLEPKAYVRDTVFTAAGLHPDSIYYFAVQPIFGTTAGYRSMGLSRRPDTGSCNGTISDGDLMLSRFVSPGSGRIGSSTELKSSGTLRLEVRNLDDQVANRFRVFVQINSGIWITQLHSGLGPKSSAVLDFPGLDFSAVGSYHIRAVVENLDKLDRVHENDTLDYFIRQLPDPVLNLASAFTENFESFSVLNLQGDSMGFSPDTRWDYFNSNDTGRLRSFVDQGICISGSRSISMDMQQNAQPVFNQLTGTFDLKSMNVQTDEVRMDFDYRLHGLPRKVDSNKVWARGSDTSRWVPLFTYDRSQPDGSVHRSGTQSVTDALLTLGQSFSSSTQIAFGQYDTSVIAEIDYGNGLTLDNFRLYQVFNDAGLAAVQHPSPVNCSLSNDEVLTVELYNGVMNDLQNIHLYYQLDGGAPVADTLALLTGKSRQSFSFRKHLDLSAYGPHSLKVWLSVNGDTYSSNDTIPEQLIYNQPLITSFPYLEDFENGPANWYSGGKNNSWEFGTPAGTAIHKAASGKNAWKTSLEGTYNNNELSYLYSPCFDISSLQHPMLSFSVNMQIENCGESFCDGAWMEYTFDGVTWTKLGEAGDGTNWYTDNVRQLWNVQGPQRWRVASSDLPKGSTPIRLRFAFSSDPGFAMDGLAVDDIHIYDRLYTSYSQGDLGPIQQNLSGTAYVPFEFQNSLLAQAAAVAAAPGETSLWYYRHEQFFDELSSQYFLPANFVLQSALVADSMRLRLYVADAEVVRLVESNDCGECDKPEDVYELGVTQYRDVELKRENNTLADNFSGKYQFAAPEQVRWVPYDAGYYVAFSTKNLGEFWFNTGGPGAQFPLTYPAISFTAQKQSDAALLQWSSIIDTSIVRYELWRSANSNDSFTQIANVASVNQNDNVYAFVDKPATVTGLAFYYRLRYFLKSGESFYAPLRQVIWSGRKAEVQLYPNPPIGGQAKLYWTCLPGDELFLVVTDITGRKVTELTSFASDYTNQIQINCEGWVRGLYFVNAQINGERFVVKMMLQ